MDGANNGDIAFAKQKLLHCGKAKASTPPFQPQRLALQALATAWAITQSYIPQTPKPYPPDAFCTVQLTRSGILRGRLIRWFYDSRVLHQ